MANGQTIGLIDKARYYIWENKHTRPLFNPKILILPGALGVFLSVMSGGDLMSFIYSLMVFFYLLVLEWLVIYPIQSVVTPLSKMSIGEFRYLKMRASIISSIRMILYPMVGEQRRIME
ncbi:MAG: hypothetical protein ACFFB2_07915 [Promethearchaeota archaeon]